MSSTLSQILKDIPQSDFVFCDLDGTLVDSEAFRIQTYYDSLQELGYSFRSLPLSSLVGNHPTVNLKLICPSLSTAQIFSNLEYRNTKLSNFVSGSINLGPNVYSTLREHFRHIIIVTNSTYQYAEAIVNHFQLNILSIVCCETFKGSQPKPSPSLYSYSFNKYLSSSHPRIVLEDSPSGLEAASQAGCDHIISISSNGLASVFSPR